MTYISSASLLSPIRASVLQAQMQLTQDQTEVSTGTLADVGLSLGEGTGKELSLKSQIDELNGYSNSNSAATTRLAATSNALSAMVSSAQSISADLVTASSSGQTTAGLQATAMSALQSLISGLNTSVGGESVFGGINTSVAPITNYFSTPTSGPKQAVDSAFQTYLTSQSTSASSISGTQMQSFLSNQFASLFSDANWQNTGTNGGWSSASSTTMQSAIAPSQTASTSVSANATPFRQITEAFPMLSEYTGSNLSSSAMSAVVSTASQLLSSGMAGLTDLQDAVGVTQNAISSANSQISSQASVLQSNVSDLDSVDTYALSSQVTTLQTQLEASYELTSRLQSLSLTTYLTTG